MKKSVAIILTIVAVVLCSCPTLVFGVASFIITSTPEGIAEALAAGQQATGITPQGDPGAGIAFAKILAGSGICLGLVVPVVVGLITFRMARKRAAQNL